MPFIELNRVIVVACALTLGCVGQDEQQFVDEGHACVTTPLWGPFTGNPEVKVDFEYCMPCSEELIDAGCDVDVDYESGIAIIDAWADLRSRPAPLFCGGCTPLVTSCPWPEWTGGPYDNIEVHYGELRTIAEHPLADDAHFCLDQGL